MNAALSNWVLLYKSMLKSFWPHRRCISGTATSAQCRKDGPLLNETSSWSAQSLLEPRTVAAITQSVGPKESKGHVDVKRKVVRGEEDLRVRKDERS